MAAAEVLTKEVIRAKNQKAADKWVAERVAEVVRGMRKSILMVRFVQVDLDTGP